MLDNGPDAKIETVGSKRDREGGQVQEGQKKKGRKGKKDLPEQQAYRAIIAAAKGGDSMMGVAVIELALSQGLKLNPDTLSSVLYLCAGGENWEIMVRTAVLTKLGIAPEPATSPTGNSSNEPATNATGDAVNANGGTVEPADAPVASTADDSNGPPDAHATANGGGSSNDAVRSPPFRRREDDTDNPFFIPKESIPTLDQTALFEKGRQLYRLIVADAKKTPETAFTSLARIEAASGNYEAAFDVAKSMAGKGVTPKLRSFTPALVAYSTAGQAEKAFEVDACILEHKLEPTESEYTELMRACVHGGGWGKAQDVLHRMARELTLLQPTTLKAVESFFTSQAARAAFAEDATLAAAGASSWLPAECTVSESGVCSACEGQLKAIDLDPEEWTIFTDGITKLARDGSKKGSDGFDRFIEWLDEHGPFDAVVDGANVALFGQNFADGGFSFSQIKMTLDLLEQGPRKGDAPMRPLLLLHIGRTKAKPAREPEAAKLLDTLRANNQLFTTPAGSNDDWYWLYAAVKAGPTGYLVSNDEMRDHIFQLLTPKFFFKWKQRHQLRYKAYTNNVVLEYPAPFTTCIQNLENGSWVFPCANGGKWLCVRATKE